MTYWHGFVIGSLTGSFITLIASGKIILTQYTEETRTLFIMFLFIIFILVQTITFYSAYKRKMKSLYGTTTDGFINGIGFMEAIIIFLLYGFRL